MIYPASSETASSHIAAVFVENGAAPTTTTTTTTTTNNNNNTIVGKDINANSITVYDILVRSSDPVISNNILRGGNLPGNNGVTNGIYLIDSSSNVLDNHIEIGTGFLESNSIYIKSVVLSPLPIISRNAIYSASGVS